MVVPTILSRVVGVGREGLRKQVCVWAERRDTKRYAKIETGGPESDDDNGPIDQRRSYSLAKEE